MYILKDKDNNIVSYSTNKIAIQDAKIILAMPEGIIEKTQEKIITNNGKAYLESQWLEYIKTDDYKYILAKENAEKEIDILKKELQNDDYKIIKSMESSLRGENAPYNTDELLDERNSKRYRINELQASFSLI